MKVIVFGCGRLGVHLARALSDKGEDVVVIDRNPRAFRLLGRDFPGGTVVGVGIDEDVLQEAGIGEADVFAAVTDGDKINIMAALIAKELYNVPQAIARISDPRMEEIYKERGLKTFCPTTLGIEKIFLLLGESPEKAED